VNGKERQTTAARRARALELLASGVPPAAVAEQLGLSPRTVRHYAADPEAKAVLRQLRGERLRQLATQALAEAGLALATLRRILEDENAPASARVSAAAKLLETAVKLVEAADLAERVEALEELLEERTHGTWRPGKYLRTWE